MTPLSPTWLRFLAHRSAADREALILAHMQVAEKALQAGWSKKVKKDQQHYVSIDGLRSAAHEGLMIAIDTYRPDRGATPNTHVSNCVRRAILNELRELDPLTRNDREKVKAGKMEVPLAAVPLTFSQVERPGRGGEERDPIGGEAALEYCVSEWKEAFRSVFRDIPLKTLEAVLLTRFEDSTLRDIVALRQIRTRLASLNYVAPAEFSVEALETALTLSGLNDRRARLRVPGSLYRALRDVGEKVGRWRAEAAG